MIKFPGRDDLAGPEIKPLGADDRAGAKIKFSGADDPAVVAPEAEKVDVSLQMLIISIF